jgi:hypothetical protein
MDNKKYLLRARFDKAKERPTHPLISFAHKMKITKDKREIEFKNRLSPDEIKKEIKKHYKEKSGKIEYFGEILYYEWYENGNLFYKFDIDGNIIESTKFISPEFQKMYNKMFEIVKKVVNEIDPFNIVWVDENEYEPEIRDLAIILTGENLSKEEIFQHTKNIFEYWFYKKRKNIPKYREIAKKIYTETIKADNGNQNK